jgi:hypothetical protein
LGEQLGMHKPDLAFQGATEVFFQFRLLFVGIQDAHLDHSRALEGFFC